MPTPRLTVAQLEQIRKTLALDPQLARAAVKAGVSENTLRSRKRILDQYDAGSYEPAEEPPQAPEPRRKTITEEPITSYEIAWREWQRYVGQRIEHDAKPPKPRKTARQKIAVIGDLHVPFHDKAALAAFVTREKDSDLCIVNGDFQDFYSVSRFTKYEHINFEDEAAEVQIVMETLSQTFPKVLIVEGNHDRPRWERQLRERLPEEMVKVVEFLAGGQLSVIGAIARRFPNVELAHSLVGSHRVSWYAQVGDLIVTHAEKFSRVPGSTLRGLDEWLMDMERTLSLDPWRIVVQAHTHQLGLFPWHADKMLVEGGCCCETHGYQLTARVGGRPQRRGWVTLEQENGRTDLNSVRLTWWDAEQDRAA